MSAGRASIKRALAYFCLCAVTGYPALADEIVMPSHRLDQNQTVDAVYRFDQASTGAGTLTFEWTDALSRLIERRQTPFTLSNDSDVHFPLDLRRAVATINELSVHLSFRPTGATDGSQRFAHLAFQVTPSGDAWRDYQIIMWQPKLPRQYAALKKLGVTAGVVFGNPSVHSPTTALSENGLSSYVENIATDFYSPYHRWSPDHPVNWRFQQIKQRYRDDPADATVFVRDPSLSDQRELNAVRGRLTKTVLAHATSRPLYYNLADEPGIAELSIAWDFDLSDPSLRAMRQWIRSQYPSLAALNRQWGTGFQDWDHVIPMTTQQAMARHDDNFSAWTDFKAWMDVAFAKALRAGTDAVHAADASALAGFEGGQVPGWGGYDYSRLAHAVDVAELYDGGGNLEILRSLNPKMVLLTTSAGGLAEVHDIWRELLRSTRGVILWDPDDDIVRKDGTLGPRALALSRAFRGIRGGIGALLINSKRHFDPIAILYSPASIRTQWLLDWKPKGDAWATRDIAQSYEDPSTVRSAMMGYAQALEHVGFHPRFVSSDLVERGALQGDRYRVLILPHAIALSSREVAEIRAFAQKGGVVVADENPGVFDEHGKKRNGLTFANLRVMRSAESCGADQALVLCHAFRRRLRQLLDQSDLKPAIMLSQDDGEFPSDVSTFVFTSGNATLVALQRDLGVPAADNRRDVNANEHIRLKLAHPSFLYDLRTQKGLGRRTELDLVLDAAEPTLVSLTPSPGAHSYTVTGPCRAKRGSIVEFRIRGAAASARALSVYRADVIAPDGRAIGHYGGTLVAVGGRALLRIPIAINDPIGTWKVELRDMVNGRTVDRALTVVAADG
jgi:hypothetical protein